MAKETKVTESKEAKMLDLKAKVYDILVEKAILDKQYRQLNEKQALLEKQIQAAKK